MSRPAPREDTAPFARDRARVAARFNAAAQDYEAAAVFQRAVAGQLCERLALMRIDPALVLDLGAGTGHGARLLERRYRRARVVQLDLALQMLRHGRRGWRRWFVPARAVCAEAERVPLADASTDLVFSSLMLQWCDDLSRVFDEVFRVLRPGGLFIFATLGPDTLAELRESWAAADDDVHVNAFLDMHNVGDALVDASLADPVMEVERFTLTYDDAFALMRDLKQLGARNANLGRHRGLTGRQRLRRMVEHYEQHRRDGKLPATYEVVYGHAWRGEHARRRDAHTAVFPVAALTRRGRKA